MTSLSAGIFRRGGPKRELFDEGRPAGDDVEGSTLETEDNQQLEAELQQQLDILKAPKLGRDWSAALWRPDVGAAEMVLTRRQTAQPIGFKWRKRHWLHPEEAAFLVDRSDLLLFVEEGGEGERPQGDGEEQGEPGTRAGRRRRLLSLQETFELMMMAGVKMERYILYSTLSRLGYLIMRYPSCWVVDNAQSPAHIWGHGAWRGGVGLLPTPLPGGPHAVSAHTRSVHQGVAPTRRCVLEGEEDDDAVLGQGEGPRNVQGQVQPPITTVTVASGPENQGLHSNSAADAQTQAHAMGSDGIQKRKRPRDLGQATDNRHNTLGRLEQLAVDDGAEGDDVSVVPDCNKTAAAEPQRTRWWPTMSNLPMMQRGAMGGEGEGGGGCPQGDAPRHAVDLPLLESIGEICPHLRPLPSIPTDMRLPGPSPSPDAYLVFDVYKPGSHVARGKKVFPTVACHISVCSSRPPTLTEMRFADSQALSTAVPVKWAAVEGGVATLYELGQADIVQLI